MSEIITNTTDGIQLLLEDANSISELVFDPLQCNSEETNDIIYTDTSQGQLCLIDGHLFSGNMETVVLQEGDDLNQYYIDAGTLEIKTEPFADEESLLNQQEVLQIVDEEGNIADIVYVDKDVDTSDYQLVDTLPKVEDEALSEPQIIRMDELMDGSYETGTILENFTDENGFQYAFVKDGRLHLQQYINDELIPIAEIDQLENISVMDNAITVHQPLFHSSEVTGRDLNTGEVVSLDRYMDRLQGRLNSAHQTKGTVKEAASSNKNEKPALNNLLNKKLFLGKMNDGKRLVGKVVDIKKKGDSVKAMTRSGKPGPSSTSKIVSKSDIALTETTKNLKDQNKSSAVNQQQEEIIASAQITSVTDSKKIVIHKKIVAKECFQHISGTLGGLMNMESVRKKLLNKTILVKVIEKRCQPGKKTVDKSVSYCSGYMDSKLVNEDGNDVRLTWSFVPDSNTKEALCGELQASKTKTFSGIINVTLLITYQKNKERVQVILDSDPDLKCVECFNTFCSKSLLKFHLKTVHQLEYLTNVQKTIAEVEKQPDDQENQNCVEQGTIKKARENNALECDICSERFVNFSALITHLSTHNNGGGDTDKVGQPKKNTSNKLYTCDVCKKNFSRHSNLQRHVDIHKGKGKLYQCTICGCAYHFISSLTRHMVQYHIQRTEEGVKITSEIEA